MISLWTAVAANDVATATGRSVSVRVASRVTSWHNSKIVRPPVDECAGAPFISEMPRFENPLMDISTEGIEARSNGDAFEANPCLEAGGEREAWEEGWRLYDILWQPCGLRKTF